jgi:uncharacterized protein (DUF2147 family)
MKKTIITFCALLMVVMAASSFKAPKDQIEKIWYNKDKTSKIQIYLAKDGAYYGKILWLKEPNDKETGKPRTDKENPDKSLHDTPLLGLLIMKSFKKSTDKPDEYTDGTIYDPKNGKT